MNVQFLGTSEFWERMCDARFRRISLHQGAIGDQIFLTDVAPEEVEGFIESKLDTVLENLGLKPLFGIRWPWRKK